VENGAVARRLEGALDDRIAAVVVPRGEDRDRGENNQQGACEQSQATRLFS
jgi:hypothetical protein